MTSDRKWKW